MTVIEYRKGDDAHFRAELLKAKDALERTREQIIRHCTMTSATLIGLIAVFDDAAQPYSTLRIMKMTSVAFLSLSVVLGVLYSFLYIRSGIASLQRSVVLYQAGGGVDYSSSGRTIQIVSALFPWVLLLGILLLSTAKRVVDISLSAVLLIGILMLLTDVLYMLASH